MSKYAICQINSKQYKLFPNVPVQIPWPGGTKLEVKTLVLANNGRIEVGKPYTKTQIKLRALGGERSKKIRVAKYHAKANYHKVKGAKIKYSSIIWNP